MAFFIKLRSTLAITTLGNDRGRGQPFRRSRGYLFLRRPPVLGLPSVRPTLRFPDRISMSADYIIFACHSFFLPRSIINVRLSVYR